VAATRTRTARGIATAAAAGSTFVLRTAHECRDECGDSESRRKHFGKRGAGRFHCSPRGWHTRPMNALWLSLLLASPWLAAIAYTWSRAPRMDGPPPSMADRTRERLWP
jgi:hypothetical protein